MSASLRIDRVHDALLVIDLQPDFMPGGALAVAEGDRVVAPVAALVPRFHTVVATQDWHPRGHVSFASSHPGKRPFDTMLLNGESQTLWPDHCVQGTPGAALHEGLPMEPVTLVLRKGHRPDADSYSAFRENVGAGGTRPPTGLAGWLRERGITRVFSCGLARDYCVRWSALDGRSAGFGVVVLEDLVRSVAPAAAAETTRALALAGVVLGHSAELEA